MGQKQAESLAQDNLLHLSTNPVSKKRGQLSLLRLSLNANDRGYAGESPDIHAPIYCGEACDGAGNSIFGCSMAKLD
jgi:hypothetical protein